jgi:hypothetical protein
MEDGDRHDPVQLHHRSEREELEVVKEAEDLDWVTKRNYFFGPALAGRYFGALTAAAAPPTAPAGTRFLLFFYALIESVKVVSDALGSDPMPTRPDFNYGVPLASFLVTALIVGGGKDEFARPARASLTTLPSAPRATA